MDINFKYEIGQLIYLRQELRRWHETFAGIAAEGKNRGYQSMGELAANERKPFKLQIIERHMQQCYGGIQLHYHVRSGDRLVPFTEPEVTTDFNDLNVVSVPPAAVEDK